MSILAENLARLLQPFEENMTPETARFLLAYRADEALRDRVQDLADKNTEGTLTPLEQAEYEAYAAFTMRMAVLQSKARRQVQASQT